MLDKLGPAINSGRGMFLFGEPGNGKTSIAERITALLRRHDLDSARAGHRRRDHPAVRSRRARGGRRTQPSDGLFDLSGVDRRWVRDRPADDRRRRRTDDGRPRSHAEPADEISEAPLQLKSNCGTLVIDDFGRQRMPVDELLNRWIVPLEKRYDFLNLPSGKKIQVPFDQLIIFSTNLEPKRPRRRGVPAADSVQDRGARPDARSSSASCSRSWPRSWGSMYDAAAVDYLIEKHYKRGEPAVPQLPAARPAAAGPQLLHLQAAARSA